VPLVKDEVCRVVPPVAARLAVFAVSTRPLGNDVAVMVIVRLTALSELDYPSRWH